MGAPARPVFRSSPGAAAHGPKDAVGRAMFHAWPLVQPAVAFGIATAATYATLCAALAIAALRGSQVRTRARVCLCGGTPPSHFASKMRPRKGSPSNRTKGRVPQVCWLGEEMTG